MNILDAITTRATRLADDMQTSLRRARVEGERRMLARQHRATLKELGLRAYELVKAGELPEEPLATEVAAVEAKLIEIEAKVAEIDRLRDDDESSDEAAEADADADAPDGDAERDNEEGPVADAALAAFPVLADAPPASEDSEAETEPGDAPPTDR